MPEHRLPRNSLIKLHTAQHSTAENSKVEYITIQHRQPDGSNGLPSSHMQAPRRLLLPLKAVPCTDQSERVLQATHPSVTSTSSSTDCADCCITLCASPPLVLTSVRATGFLGPWGLPGLAPPPLLLLAPPQLLLLAPAGVIAPARSPLPAGGVAGTAAAVGRSMLQSEAADAAAADAGAGSSQVHARAVAPAAAAAEGQEPSSINILSRSNSTCRHHDSGCMAEQSQAWVLKMSCEWRTAGMTPCVALLQAQGANFRLLLSTSPSWRAPMLAVLV